MTSHTLLLDQHLTPNSDLRCKFLFFFLLAFFVNFFWFNIFGFGGNDYHVLTKYLKALSVQLAGPSTLVPY